MRSQLCDRKKQNQKTMGENPDHPNMIELIDMIEGRLRFTVLQQPGQLL
jgi:hypothetical protein